MTSFVAESWTRIEAWLSAHAPRTFAELPAPADPPAIAMTENAIGLDLPSALRESLLRHDGTAYGVLLPPFWTLLSTRQIVDSWTRRTDIHASEVPDAEDDDHSEGPYGPWWHRRWVPFAENGAGDCLVIDERPTRLRGRIGTADHEDGCRFSPHPMWNSLPDLLAMTATALETGALLDCYERVAVDGALTWTF
ncbi:SMI1/KNR4 family protein [Streptomyces griseorubiginosus]|uniref:SMI1/KNR4 family protein n=1 Tax=Streptomyces griseorubiginosus TaxID=67304 RepID=UPI00366945E4